MYKVKSGTVFDAKAGVLGNDCVYGIKEEYSSIYSNDFIHVNGVVGLSKNGTIVQPVVMVKGDYIPLGVYLTSMANEEVSLGLTSNFNMAYQSRLDSFMRSKKPTFSLAPSSFLIANFKLKFNRQTGACDNSSQFELYMAKEIVNLPQSLAGTNADGTQKSGIYCLKLVRKSHQSRVSQLGSLVVEDKLFDMFRTECVRCVRQYIDKGNSRSSFLTSRLMTG